MERGIDIRKNTSVIKARHLRLSKALGVCLIVVLVMALSSCGGGGSSSGGGSYSIPEYRDAAFDESSAEGNSDVMVDTSHSSEGYFGVKCNAGGKIKLQVLKDGDTYTYDLVNGEDDIFPFSLGNGSYTIKVMKNVSGNKYSEMYACSADVKISDEFDPFLRPNQYADYDKDSDCVQKAGELASSASDANDYITKVYDYVCDNVSYDEGKAASVQSGYIPDPDSVMSDGKGICFDYASLAASMLRSQGIPTKIIFGYAGGDSSVYHAWNMYYTKESGWVAVEFEVKANDWNRLDLTFSAGGADSKYIGDGSNYMDVYQY